MNIDPYSAIKISVLVGFFCVLVGFFPALLFGWLLARKKFWGKSLFNLIIFFPMTLPPLVTGLILLKFLGRESFLGNYFLNMGLPLTFSLPAAVLASFVVGLPLYVMMIRLAFESSDLRYEELAKTLGLSPFKIFLKISLPLAWPGILAGSVISFARAMGEFGATSILAGNIEGETRTISLALYSLLDSPEGVGSGHQLIIASLLLSFLSLASYELLLKWHRKRLELND